MMKKSTFFPLILLSLFTINGQSQSSALIKISNAGHTAYHVDVGIVNSERVVFSASYDGYVACHNYAGELIWSAHPGNGFPFDLESADIDLDGNEEALVASSDGNLYVFDDDGQLMWTFQREAPLYQVEAFVDGTDVTILTGGIQRILYSLDPSGNIRKQLNVNGVVRQIGFGEVSGNGQNQAVVTTTRSALSGNVIMYLYNESDMTQIWTKEIKYDANANLKGRFFSMQIFDIDKDGSNEILMGRDHTQPDKFTVVNPNGTYETLFASVRPRIASYTMNLVHHISSPDLGDEYLINHYGHKLIVMDLNGTIINQLSAPYAFTNSLFDPDTNILWLGSGVSGGDGIYGLKLDDPLWKTAYSSLRADGKMKTLEANLASLNQQIDDFTALNYQAEVNPFQLCVQDRKYHQLPAGYFENVKISDYLTWTEDYDRSFLASPWNTKIDPRKPYDMSYNEIINKAKDMEARDKAFFLWSGHGMDPFYLRLETMEGILQAAPTAFKGFIFAELERTDAAMEYVVNNHIIPLAELCIKYGKRKIYFRNKNIFWNGNMYLDLWQRLFNNEKYQEIFVAGLEETNCRTQELSLSARLGLRMTDRFGEIGVRPVTDNGNFVRTFEWCQMQRMSHQMRAGAIARMFGANIYVQDLHTTTEEELYPLYKMIDKGILPMVAPEDIISVPDVAIGIKIPPDHDYIEHGTNGHVITGYSPSDPDMVFDRLDCYWGGALVPEHDFTNFAFGSKRRMTNFIPRYPFGNIAIVPGDLDTSIYNRFKKVFVTDGKNWYDDEGGIHSPLAYKSTVMTALQDAASRLPVRVEGDVSWAAVKISSGHFRVVIIDPGYVDPADREAKIIFQNLQADQATDILRKENLAIVNNEISLTIPMGILRVVDIVTYPYADAGDDIQIDYYPVDSVNIYGSGGDDVEIASYKWEQTGGEECTLINPDSATLTVKDLVEGEFIFKLLVTDNEGNTASDEMRLNILCEACHTPEVDAGADRIVMLPWDTVKFEGTANVQIGTILSVQWSQLSGNTLSLEGKDANSLEVSDLTEGEFRFRFTATSDEGYAAYDEVVLQVLPEPDVIRKNMNQIIIDGEAEETWCGKFVGMDKILSGFVSYSSTVSFLWDETYLYVYVEVEDSYLMNDSDEEWWNDDAVQIFIDADNSKGSAYETDDFYFGFRWHWDSDRMDAFEKAHGSLDESIKWKLIEVNGGYQLEAAFPWAVLNKTPSSGEQIGLEVRVIFDDDGGDRDAVMALFGLSEEFEPVPSEFGTISLGEECPLLNLTQTGAATNILLYPAITDQLIRISSDKPGVIVYEIRDIFGRNMGTGRFNSSREIDCSVFPSGMYYIRFFDLTTNDYQIKRFIKK